MLQAIKATLRSQGKQVCVIAPTGKAAFAIEGTTMWSYAGLRPEDNTKKLDALRGYAGGNKYIRKRFRQADVIIIDEIIMAENLHLECLNYVMQTGCYGDRPLGSVLIILTGDLYQLPLVKQFQHCVNSSEGFQSDVKKGEEVFNCKTSRIQAKESGKWAFCSAASGGRQFYHPPLKRDDAWKTNDVVFACLLADPCRY